MGVIHVWNCDGFAAAAAADRRFRPKLVRNDKPGTNIWFSGDGEKKGRSSDLRKASTPGGSDYFGMHSSNVSFAICISSKLKLLLFKETNCSKL